jgi:ABC-type sulfate/molybdate transport systems ATPase subunit
LDIAKDTLQVLKRLDDHGRGDADLKLLDDAYQLSAFEGSDTKTIAVLGDSGEGVSSRLRVAMHANPGQGRVVSSIRCWTSLGSLKPYVATPSSWPQ